MTKNKNIIPPIDLFIDSERISCKHGSNFAAFILNGHLKIFLQQVGCHYLIRRCSKSSYHIIFRKSTILNFLIYSPKYPQRQEA